MLGPGSASHLEYQVSESSRQFIRSDREFTIRDLTGDSNRLPAWDADCDVRERIRRRFDWDFELGVISEKRNRLFAVLSTSCGRFAGLLKDERLEVANRPAKVTIEEIESFLDGKFVFVGVTPLPCR